jgi:hypothetical protein
VRDETKRCTVRLPLVLTHFLDTPPLIASLSTPCPAFLEDNGGHGGLKEAYIC